MARQPMRERFNKEVLQNHTAVKLWATQNDHIQLEGQVKWNQIEANSLN